MPPARTRLLANYLNYLIDWHEDRGRPTSPLTMPQHKCCKNCCSNNRTVGTFALVRSNESTTEITAPFQWALEQIGDASAATDHFRAIVGPAAERDFHCAGIWAAGRDGADLARWPDALAADGDAGVAARQG